MATKKAAAKKTASLQDILAGIRKAEDDSRSDVIKKSAAEYKKSLKGK